MGFTVASFERAPIGEYEFSIFVITNRKDAVHNRWIDKNFLRIAEDVGPDAAIVKGHNDAFSDELKSFLERWMTEDHNSEAAQVIWRLLDRATCLLIARKDIKSTNAPLLLIPLAPASASEMHVRVNRADAEKFIRELMQSVVEKVRDGTILKHAQELGAARLKFKGVRNGVMISTLRHANDVLELKPNLAGMGLNLNAMIEKALGEARRA